MEEDVLTRFFAGCSKESKFELEPASKRPIRGDARADEVGVGCRIVNSESLRYSDCDLSNEFPSASTYDCILEWRRWIGSVEPGLEVLPRIER
jgi:hypothetical protein